MSEALAATEPPPADVAAQKTRDPATDDARDVDAARRLAELRDILLSGEREALRVAAAKSAQELSRLRADIDPNKRYVEGELHRLEQRMNGHSERLARREACEENLRAIAEAATRRAVDLERRLEDALSQDARAFARAMDAADARARRDEEAQAMLSAAIERERVERRAAERRAAELEDGLGRALARIEALEDAVRRADHYPSLREAARQVRRAVVERGER